MNCKQGDLAIVVRGAYKQENLGKIVRCLKFVPSMLLRVPEGITVHSNLWVVEPYLIAFDGKQSEFASDSCLQPIGNPSEDEQDEMLRPLPMENLNENA